jgi:hypothetical protein
MGRHPSECGRSLGYANADRSSSSSELLTVAYLKIAWSSRRCWGTVRYVLNTDVISMVRSPVARFFCQEKYMTKTFVVALLTSAVMIGANAASAQNTAPAGSAAGSDNQPAPMVMLVPIAISDPAMQSGCWAQFYDERNFKGDILTVAGPMQLATTDKAGGRQLHRSIDSLTVGPKATLTVYEHKLFRDKSVTFAPNSREAGLIKKLGFTGRIESLKLDCAS